MYRMYGMPQGAREGGAAMYRMYGMPQGAREGGAAILKIINIFPQMNTDTHRCF